LALGDFGPGIAATALSFDLGMFFLRAFPTSRKATS
jgi:hypothetical protein